ncbi:TetR/AcrR family transcriptional regulator [Paraburkholderia fungorum]|uniref:TetR/AcrR family transcriptional regulator n=1 Tax=Paraburkholderia fungorum TaxID=134537 RepID=UPI0038BD66C6
MLAPKLTVIETRMPAEMTGEKSTKRMTKASRPAVDRTVWLDAARSILVDQGIDAVKVEPLAAMLEISRSSFYWNFKSRQELLDALIEYWTEFNDRALRELVQPHEEDPKEREQLARKRLRQLMNLFIDEREFSSDFDMAMREWARKDPAVAKRVARIDRQRIAHLQKIFEDMGHSKPDSLIRAKLLYFHQLGYYLTGIKESEEVRKRVAPRYLELLSGLKL